jgi:hypothetical protein
MAMATAAKAGKRPAYRNPDVAEARRRRQRRQVKPYRQLSSQQIGTKVAAGQRARAKAAAQPAPPPAQQAAQQPAQPAAPRQAPAAARAQQAAPAAAGGGLGGAYRRGVAGPVRQAWQARTAGQEGAGAVLALFLYPLLINGLRGGPARARGWLAAKFVNRPYGGGPGAGKGGKPVPRINVVGPGGPGHRPGRP